MSQMKTQPEALAAGMATRVVWHGKEFTGVLTKTSEGLSLETADLWKFPVVVEYRADVYGTRTPTMADGIEDVVILPDPQEIGPIKTTAALKAMGRTAWEYEDSKIVTGLSCENCSTSYATCTHNMLRGARRKPCCASCAYTDTHSTQTTAIPEGPDCEKMLAEVPAQELLAEIQRRIDKNG